MNVDLSEWTECVGAMVCKKESAARVTVQSAARFSFLT